MIKLQIMDLVEEYQLNKTIINNTDLEISLLTNSDDIQELKNRKSAAESRITLTENYDYSYILSDTETSIIKSAYMDKPIEKIHEKFNLSEDDYDYWLSLIKKKLKRVSIYIAQ